MRQNSLKRNVRASARKIARKIVAPASSLILAIAGLVCPAVLGQTAQAAQSPQEGPPRLSLLAVTYPEGESVKVLLKGTARLMQATGQAQVKRRPGITEIEVELDGMKPAISIGGDFNTYILWTISPEGIAWNAGEFVLQGAKSKLKVTSPLTEFGMFVTAEPHFLVRHPSRFFVLLNLGDGLEQKKGVATIPFEYETIRTGYSYKQPNLLEASETKGRLRTERFQAYIAVRLARDAGADRWAPEEFSKAEAALGDTQQGVAQGLSEKELALLSHRAVRLAVESARLAEERSSRAALENERRNSKETIEHLTLAKQNAEALAVRSRDEAARARQAAERAQAQAKEAEDKMFRASQEAERYAREKLEAQKQVESAERQAAAGYARLEGALSRVSETRETARGLIVNLPDILFDSGKSTLRPRAREVLSRIAGVLLVAPEYRLSIEGHTDSVGRREANQRLSEERALSVYEYLVEAQVSPALMTTRGFGESQPVESNRTAAGRQRNRRVEIVIEGLTR